MSTSSASTFKTTKFIDYLYGANYVTDKIGIGIIGGGTMAKSIFFPLFDKGILEPSRVSVTTQREESLEDWKKYGANCYKSDKNNEIIKNSTVVIWAVKPQVFQKLVSNNDIFKSSPNARDYCMLHVSLMAGISLEQFYKSFDKKCLPATGFIRVMANIACKVGAGCAVYSLHNLDNVPDENAVIFIKFLFDPIATSLCVPDSQINAFCALHGSGLGFMFPILEAMSDGAVKCGIPRETSLKFAAQTMKGAAELFLAENKHPGALKDSVCSPSGTTIAGIAKMEECGVRNGIISAIEAATVRGDEIGKLMNRNNNKK